MSPTAQSGRGAGVGDEASEGQQKYARESYEARSLLQPPFDGASSSPDCHETRESRRNPEDQDDVAQHAERLWRAGSRCHRDQDETKSDSDRSDGVERAGSDEVLGNPDQVGRRQDADNADSADAKAEHERQGLHDISFALPNAQLHRWPEAAGGLSGRDGIEMPFTREPLENLDAAVFKRDSGPSNQVLHGARHEHLAGAGQ
jgi:hypothetical protein